MSDLRRWLSKRARLRQIGTWTTVVVAGVCLGALTLAFADAIAARLG